MQKISALPCRGYIEGYYGQLPSWDMRISLIRQLSERGFSSYFYAPKEDLYHRLNWREPYPAQWREQFSLLTTEAKDRSIQIIAGVAPGLDFNFEHINGGADFTALANKSRQLLNDGATAIALLMDDINTEFNPKKNGPDTEGLAHAMLANALSAHIGHCIYVVPRVYAKELEYESENYAHYFGRELKTGNVIFHCGTHIVAPSIQPTDFKDFTDGDRHRVVVWDNLYANDYCPRRLFVGSWLGREKLTDVMLNPTGLPATDALLMDMMAGTSSNADAAAAREHALAEHGVPEPFETIADYFSHPPFSHINRGSEVAHVTYTRQQQLASIEVLLWKWKSPLSREWYPYLFGLKHDLLVSANELTELRIRKTQLSPLADRLANKLT